MNRVLGRLRRTVSAATPEAAPAPPDGRLGGLVAAVPDALGEALARARTVGLLVDAQADVHGLVAELQALAPGAAVHRFDVAVGAADLHVELAGTGPYDLLVDAASDAVPSRAARARAVLLHLLEGGPLVVLDARPGVEPLPEPTEGELDFADLVAEAFIASLREEVRLKRRADDRSSWGRAVGAAVVVEGHLVLVNRLRAWAKIREEQVGRYLELRGPATGRVLTERPGSVLDNPTPVRQSPADDPPAIATHFEAPPLQLREYADVVCRRGQVVSQGHVLLPETYRHLARPRLGNRYVEDVAPAFGRTRIGGTEPLPGTYFHLDSEYRGHFGHAMTEQISRLWAWDEVKRLYPDAKVLLTRNKFRVEIYDWERRLYRAAGIDPDDLVLLGGAIRVERLLAATPMFSQPEFIHTGSAALYRRIGDDLAADAPDRDYPERIFCSRRNDKRSCHNIGEVEEFFRARGFTIVYPEDHPLGEQVQLFRSARDVAGFGGSAMFTMAFDPRPKRVVLVSSENYYAQNEFLIAAVGGHQVNVAWCRPDKPRALGYSGEEAMQSQFTFDPGREGRFLDEVLDG